VVEHIDLDLEVDFDRERIGGRATLHIHNKRDSDRLVLDTRELNIERVTLGHSEAPADFVIGESVEFLGQPLVIDITPQTELVHIDYTTSEGASALDWLEVAQTADGKRPFLYTQGQSIQNRSWIPCQDTPGVRVTYRAKIKTPPGMLAVMSARNPTAKNPQGIYLFDMPQPIAPYLIALAVGDLEFRAISDRCGVYAEPSVVDEAAWEFADTEAMMQKAEALYGKYRWERFDVIVLPPSFPYGGMENPRLTFVTPVLVAGDRSLVSTIAHELAHSWSGNLVTNATWSDFWLNEGFTTYLERRILEALYGRDRMEMEAALGFGELAGTLGRVEPDDPDTRLRNDLAGRDPDDGLSWIAYEKGYVFLRLLEERVGRERWDNFLRGYFDRFAFQPMTTERFVAYLRGELISGARSLEDAIMIEEWVYGTGLPDNSPRIHSSAFEEIAAAVELWKSGTPARELPTAGWSSQEWKEFMQRLPTPMTMAQMTELDEAFHLTNGSNAEILQVWFLRAIESGYEPAYPYIETYLVSIGRIWLIESIYRKLAETPEGMEMAKRIYAKARPGYHPLAVGAVDRILQPGG
jgi:aminopeptidase N